MAHRIVAGPVGAAAVTRKSGLGAAHRFLLRLITRYPIAFIGLLIILVYVLAAVLAPQLAPFAPDDFTLGARLKPPVGFHGAKAGHWLGTDELGRDLLTRALYGARVSIGVGVFTVAVAVLVGTGLGALAGYLGGWVDGVLSRVADLLMAFPYLLFTILMMGVLGPGFTNLIVALAFKAWVEFFRLVRGEVLAEKARDYVEAARAIGASDLRIIVRAILPNVAHTIVVLATLRMGYLMIMEASLSFLGLGLPPGVPAWGSMVAAGREKLMEAWWVSTVPGLVILVLVLAINAFGEGLRDLLDPRQAEE